MVVNFTLFYIFLKTKQVHDLWSMIEMCHFNSHCICGLFCKPLYLSSPRTWGSSRGWSHTSSIYLFNEDFRAGKAPVGEGRGKKMVSQRMCSPYCWRLEGALSKMKTTYWSWCSEQCDQEDLVPHQIMSVGTTKMMVMWIQFSASASRKNRAPHADLRQPLFSTKRNLFSSMTTFSIWWLLSKSRSSLVAVG